MSRCFPFPPPGYAGKCSSQEALILSIKLQREKEAIFDREAAEKLVSNREKDKSKSLDKKKDKEGRKEKKRDREEKKDKKDKDERRKEKKQKREKKAKAIFESGKQSSADKFSKAVNVLGESKGKLIGNNVELLERSSVTEEQGQPLDSQNAPCSSDSTGNSGKRKKSLPSPSGIQSNGNIIRIRLSTSQKRDEPSTSGSKDQEVVLPQLREDFVTSYSQVRPSVRRIRPESSIKLEDVIPKNHGLSCPASTSTATLQLVSSDVKGKAVESESQNENIISNDKIQSLEKLSSRDKRMQKKELAYKKLVVDWVPPSLESILMVAENDDDDWLFGKKDEDRTAKRLTVSEETQNCGDSLPCSASAVMQPRAHFLADAGIYALPFTVPF